MWIRMGTEKGIVIETGRGIEIGIRIRDRASDGDWDCLNMH